jgi:hypothetical protein
MSALTDARARLAAGYYNSSPKSVGNPGGLAANGHQINFPAACADLGLTLTQAGIDAAALAAAMPTITAGVTAAADAMTYRDQAKAYRDQAQEIVGTDLTLKANIASPAFTGTPTAPTRAQSDNSNAIATTAFVTGKFSALVGAAPGALDTIYELAAQMQSDESAAAALTTLVGTKLPLAGGTLTGDLTFSDPSAAQRNLTFNYPGAAILFYGNTNAVGVFDNASGAGEVWTYARATKTLSLRAGAQVGGSLIYTAANLSPVDLASTQVVTGQKSFITPNSSMTNTGSIGVALMVQGTSTGPAVFALHRPGSFATYLGLDTDNQLKVGGWSNGPNAWVLYHSGNDGAGSGLDADLFRGAAPDTAASANTIAKRGGDGSLLSTQFNAPGTGSLYFSTYGGGFYMSDVTWVRVVGDKSIATGGAIQGGTVTGTSDARLKSEIRDLEPVAGLVPRRFVKDGLQRLGYIAQEVQAVAPEAVHQGEFLSLEPLAMIAAVQAQLEERIRVLEARLLAAGVGA